MGMFYLDLYFLKLQYIYLAITIGGWGVSGGGSFCPKLYSMVHTISLVGVFTAFKGSSISYFIFFTWCSLLLRFMFKRLSLRKKMKYYCKINAIL